MKRPGSSLPRRRESRKALTNWIPASAGMTEKKISRVHETPKKRGWIK
jgi:hypothetical protein